MFKNIPESLFVTNQEEIVDVTVEGSMLALDKLSSSDFVCAADLNSIDSEGSHVVRLTVTGPKDIDIIKVSRSEITVYLSSGEPGKKKSPVVGAFPTSQPSPSIKPLNSSSLCFLSDSI